MGYSIAVFLEYVMTVLFCVFLGNLATIGISAYFVGAALAEDIRGHLDSINDAAKTKKTRLEFVKQFGAFVESHSLAKQLSVVVCHVS